MSPECCHCPMDAAGLRSAQQRYGGDAKSPGYSGMLDVGPFSYQTAAVSDTSGQFWQPNRRCSG